VNRAARGEHRDRQKLTGSSFYAESLFERDAVEPDFRAISRGCFDDPDAVEVSSQIWTRSAQSGVALPAGMDCFAMARATLDGQPLPAVRYEAPVMVGQGGGEGAPGRRGTSQ
jgi:hypothetical protein